MRWHNGEIEEVLAELGSSPQGLSNDDARRRLVEHGRNELRKKKGKGPFVIFLSQFTDFIILVLIAAAVISGLIGDLWDTLAIVTIIILNAVIGFIQEYRAEKAISALKRMAAFTATVLRKGVPAIIPAPEVVPGDIVILEAGKVVPADMRIIETSRLTIVEAALTGESVPVEKITKPLFEEMLSLGDRRNMAYSGTVVSYGRGKGVVVNTGMKTELGVISAMLQEEEEGETPLQRRLERFGRKLVFAILCICAVIFGAGILRGEPPLLMFLTVVSLAVAAVPEALPAVVTISLALGAKKMVGQKALIRKLSAVETLGSVTYICSDKTGTLTMNEMSVEEIYADERVVMAKDLEGTGKLGKEGTGSGAINLESSESLLMAAIALSNDAGVDAEGRVMGDPSEVALYAVAQDHGFAKSRLEEEFPRVAEVPFDSERKCMTTIHRSAAMTSSRTGESGASSSGSLNYPESESAVFISFTKGAADFLVDKASTSLTSSGLVPIDRARILAVNDQMASNGLRVLGVAVRRWKALPEDLSSETVERDLTFLGLVGLIDPPRKEAKDAVLRCMSAGITPVMITGDHPLTARAIARRIGILENDHAAMMTGAELEAMPPERLQERVEHIRVFARVAPEQKLGIVKALQMRGHFVAVTGDGVNDAPALKKGNIGIAMGMTGTDVAKEASHMILLDDNFATIVRAVREGRKIYDNIRKFIRYLLTTNSGEIWTLFLAPFLGLPVPLLPIHILWINLMTDGLPALSLSAEPEEGDVMNRPPRPPEESIFAHGLGIHVLWVGLLMAAIVLFVQDWSIRTNHGSWQTMVFTVLCLTQLGHVLAIRSEKRSFFKSGIFSNPYLIAAVVLTFSLQMAVIYVPFLNPIFKTVPLSLAELVFTLALSSTVFFAVEAEKAMKRRTRE